MTNRLKTDLTLVYQVKLQHKNISIKLVFELNFTF